MTADDEIRAQFADVILTHWRTPTSGCKCGQIGLGESYPAHVADALLARIRAVEPTP
jgi:hypothetical protein